MKFIHYDIHTGSGDAVMVTLSQQARVLLLDSANFSAYRNGRSFRHYGGWATRSPLSLTPPRVGRWHVVVDLNGRAGRVRSSVRVARCA